MRGKVIAPIAAAKLFVELISTPFSKSFMINHLTHAIEVSPVDYGMEDNHPGAFDGTIELIEVVEADLEEDEEDYHEFPLNQVAAKAGRLEVGFYTIVALSPGTFPGEDVLGWNYHATLQEAAAMIVEMQKEYDFDEEADLPQPVEEGRFKLVDTFNGWESQDRYATEADAEKVMEYRKRKFYSSPGTEGNTWCEIVIDAEASWEFNPQANTSIGEGKFRWILDTKDCEVVVQEQ